MFNSNRTLFKTSFWLNILSKSSISLLTLKSVISNILMVSNYWCFMKFSIFLWALMILNIVFSTFWYYIWNWRRETSWFEQELVSSQFAGGGERSGMGVSPLLSTLTLHLNTLTILFFHNDSESHYPVVLKNRKQERGSIAYSCSDISKSGVLYQRSQICQLIN